MGKARTKYEIIRNVLAEESNILSVKELCAIAGVSRSGYYRWLNTQAVRDKQKKKDKEDFPNHPQGIPVSRL